MAKVYWLSRHELSPGQIQALRDLHGADVEVVREPVVFQTAESLADFIRQHPDGFVYAVAGAPHYRRVATGLAATSPGFGKTPTRRTTRVKP
ncbi:MAG: hypothetical protein UY53_C0002G0036 [Parcubacteria group bacterium GW2011_GWA2_50_10]|nr:MAG: hypothetical protein UY53_C0002G0036 [Parcubacteria group bacterium GW2011_GWA2_50_10]